MKDTAEKEREQKTGSRRALGTMLIERGLLDDAQLDEALRVGTESGERLGEVVVRLGWVSEEDLAKVLADQWQLRYLDRSGISFDSDALNRLSREEAIRLEALPMRVDGDGSMLVALAEPTEARLLALRSLLGDRIAPVVVPKSALDVGLRGDLLVSRGSRGVPLDEAVPVDESESALSESASSESASAEPPDTDAAAEAAGPAPSQAPASDNGSDPYREEPVTELTPLQFTSDDASDFDGVATSIVDDLTVGLGSLRGLVVEARSTAVEDRTTISRLEEETARLRQELTHRDEEISRLGDELSQKNATIGEMKQALRTLADHLD